MIPMDITQIVTAQQAGNQLLGQIVKAIGALNLAPNGGASSITFTSTTIATFDGNVFTPAAAILPGNLQALRLRATILNTGTTPVSLGLVNAAGNGWLAVWQTSGAFALYRENAGSHTSLLSTSFSRTGTNRMVTLEFDITADTTNGHMISASIGNVGVLGVAQDATYNITSGVWYLAAQCNGTLSNLSSAVLYSGAA